MSEQFLAAAQAHFITGFLDLLDDAARRPYRRALGRIEPGCQLARRVTSRELSLRDLTEKDMAALSDAYVMVMAIARELGARNTGSYSPPMADYPGDWPADPG